MLTSLRLINFKNHEDTLIEGLQPLSVFVGPNAVGKSSILEAVQLVSDFGDPRKEKELQASIPEMARLGSDEFSIDAKGETSGESWQVDVNFTATTITGPRSTSSCRNRFCRRPSPSPRSSVKPSICGSTPPASRSQAPSTPYPAFSQTDTAWLASLVT